MIKTREEFEYGPKECHKEYVPSEPLPSWMTTTEKTPRQIVDELRRLIRRELNERN